jgi:hypothetical protein
MARTAASGAKRPFVDLSTFVGLHVSGYGNGAHDHRRLACVSGSADGLMVTGLNDFDGPAQTTNLAWEAGVRITLPALFYDFLRRTTILCDRVRPMMPHGVLHQALQGAQ